MDVWNSIFCDTKKKRVTVIKANRYQGVCQRWTNASVRDRLRPMPEWSELQELQELPELLELLEWPDC